MEESILVVDDDESLLEICEAGLRLAGYRVTCAVSGEAAIKRLQAEKFDLVITDLSMPGSTDGQAVVRAARACAAEAVVMTATPTLATAIATLKDGAYDYILKPFAVDRMNAVVRRCLDHRKLRGELASEKALRQELSSAYEELQKVEQLKEAILARMSHEIKTPLSELLMALHLILDLFEHPQKDDAGQGKKYTQMALAGYERMERTLSNLLAFSDMKKSLSLEGAAVPVDLEALCRGTVERLRPLWEPRGLSVLVEFELGAGPVQGSQELLEKALEHLVHNAILFNRPAGSVRVRGKRTGDRVEISVSDTGEGIPETEIKRIFDSFYQVAHYLTRKVDGLGLGLAIARRIAEAHGGHIAVASKVGEGSTFTLSLPAA